jgi:hypothetical protein
MLQYYGMLDTYHFVYALYRRLLINQCYLTTFSTRGASALFLSASFQHILPMFKSGKLPLPRVSMTYPESWEHTLVY